MLTIGSLANIKHILQKELFNNSAERVLSVCTVTKTYKKKKASYLCIVSTPPPHPVVTVCQVKQTEKEGEYKKKRFWQLDEVKTVDGRNEHFETHEFDVQLDKTYKWYAISLHERQNFLAVLHKQINKYVRGDRAEFKNIPIAWLDEKSPEKTIVRDEQKAVQTSDEEDESEDFQALTEKEVSELNKLVNECDFAIKDAELFIEQLGKKLHDLDGANIQSVLASEQQVLCLMEEIEKAVFEADKFEVRLDSYDEILGHVRETMEKVGSKNAMIEIANNNNIKLLNELNKVISQLDLPVSHQHALSEPDLKTTAGREAAIAAGKSLQQAMNSDIDPALLRLAAVQDQRKRFEKWKSKFSVTVSRYLNNLFIHLGNDIGDSHTMSSNELVLPTHVLVHKELAVYTELMHWTKSMDRKTYDGLAKVYTSSLSKIYERDIKTFFSYARQQILSKLRQDLREDLDGSISSKSKLATTKQVTVAYGTLGVNKEFWSVGVDLSERERFDTVLEKVLAELEPIALQEQLFCINFFQMDVISPSTKNTQTTLDVIEKENESKDLAESTLSSSQPPFPQRRIDRQINEEVRKMMMALFGILETELLSFIQSYEKIDSFYSLYVLVRLTQHVMSAQDTHSFLSMTFASALVQVKRNFDRFMQQQIQSIKDAKLPKRSKCGILPYVENFEDFANTSEGIFRKSDRRADMDKWYLQLVNTIFESIPSHAEEHAKTPSQVIKMENYHHMYAILAQLKVPGLESAKKDAKTRYNDALKSYVIKYFGRPLEKLNLFFEGVQQKVAQGVKETEISYQMAFSKQELRKVIGQYPAREVKKGLENLYKKVEKHLCEEENLLQVVWYAMQDEFIAQYKYLEERIQKCYAGAMINLEFSIDDILTYFSDIARSH